MLLDELVAHVVTALGPLLPPPLVLVAAHHQVLLTTGRSGRAVATHTMTTTSPGADVGSLARYVLTDVQDLVALHLGTPWPLAGNGEPTHPWAEASGPHVRMAFRGATDRVDLPDFLVPTEPATRPAG